MRNWMISQFQGILLRSCTIGILSRFSEVIKQLESKHLNILKTFLIYWCKTFCYFLLLFFFFFKPVTTQNFELVSDVQKVSSKIRAGSYQFSFLIVLLQVSNQWSFVVNDMRGWCLRSVLPCFVLSPGGFYIFLLELFWLFVFGIDGNSSTSAVYLLVLYSSYDVGIKFS